MSTRKGRTCISTYQDWCKGCGLCVAFCPTNVFELGPAGKVQVAREEDCVNCGFCELHCPDFAIVVQPKDEFGRCAAPEAAQQLHEQMKG